jgi:hypothetical protein
VGWLSQRVNECFAILQRARQGRDDSLCAFQADLWKPDGMAGGPFRDVDALHRHQSIDPRASATMVLRPKAFPNPCRPLTKRNCLPQKGCG